MKKEIGLMFTLLMLVFSGCELLDSLTKLPVVETVDVTEIMSNSVLLTGNVVNDGDTVITERGFCWNTTSGVDINDNSISSDGDVGFFYITITNLQPSTTYYVKAFATNSHGTSYGSEISFTTAEAGNTDIGTFVDVRDGQIYGYANIGNQTWMTRNLSYLPSVHPPTYTDLVAYYVYNYNGTDVSQSQLSEEYLTYGALYTWNAAMAGQEGSDNNPSNVQGICPAGWHIPSKSEWEELRDYLGGIYVAGGPLKEGGTAHWQFPNSGADNSTGFTGLPGGMRGTNGVFGYLEVEGAFWSSTDLGEAVAWYSKLRFNNTELHIGNGNNTAGFSVRCVKNP